MKKLISKFYRQTVYRKRKYLLPPTKLYKRLLESQYWERNKTEVYQLNILNELINKAKINTAYYKDIINGDISHFESLENFTKTFPLLKKEDLVINKNKLINSNENPRFKHFTSGSTGTPMVFEISGMAEVYREACRMRFLSWWDISINDKNIYIWAVKKSSESSYWMKIKNWMRNRLLINVFDLNQHNILKYFKEIEKFQPIYIRGYKSALMQLTSLMEENNLKLKNSKLKAIIVTSEVLFENERKYIERILDCKVANEYGSAELGLYAAECPAGGMHINEEAIYITSDKNKNAIVTDLHNNAMPLINYKNNDRISISNNLCSCGRTMRIVENVEGRINDLVECPDGTTKSSTIFSYIMNEAFELGNSSKINQYRVTQSNYNFLVEIFVESNLNEQLSDYIKNRMREAIGENIYIDVKYVKEIKREKSGKLRYFINKNRN